MRWSPPWPTVQRVHVAKASRWHHEDRQAHHRLSTGQSQAIPGRASLRAALAASLVATVEERARRQRRPRRARGAGPRALWNGPSGFLSQHPIWRVRGRAESDLYNALEPGAERHVDRARFGVRRFGAPDEDE